MYICVLSVCTSVSHVWIVPMETEEGFGFPRSGVSNGCEPVCKC